MILSEAIKATGVEVHEWLDREADVPVVSKVAAQGDISVRRVDHEPASTVLPAAGVVLVRSEVSTHTHTLHGIGVFFDPATGSQGPTDLRLGKLTVPEGREALISHQEHGALLITPGTYVVGRQREFAGEWAYVAD